MTISTTATFTITIAVLTLADSLMPITMSTVTAMVMNTAGRLITASGLQPEALTSVHGADATDAGMSMPAKSWKKLTRCPDHPTATVAAPSAYSRMRSHPMTHAKN